METKDAMETTQPGRLLVGTSGFSYKQWIGSFYPEGTKQSALLAAYASLLPSVEINYTFRQLPSEKTIAGWMTQTPEDFVFTLKASKRITHDQRLVDVDESLRAFLERGAGLGARFGPILVQCPPSLSYRPEVLDDFLAITQRVSPPGQQYALEMRHPSWAVDEVYDKLRVADVAWVIADTDERDAEFVRTSDRLVYVRLRKTDYSLIAIKAWVPPIRSALASGADVAVYLKHEETPEGAYMAVKLRELVADSG